MKDFDKMIYADNAATTQLDIEAFEAMKPFLLSDFANASQPYSFARSAKQAIKKARETIAECINADPDEIFFTSGGTESDNWAIKGFCKTYRTGDILTTSIEHHAILNSCFSVEQLGRKVVYVDPQADGSIDVEQFKRLLTNEVKFVSVMYANNEIGTVQPIQELCEISHKQGVVFHTDAVQVVGHLKVDVKELGVDMLSASAHKFNGPKGIGFLYVRKGVQIMPYMDGGAQEKKHRAGTENVAAIVAMAVALQNNCLQLEKNIKHLDNLSRLLIERLVSFGCNFQKNGGERTLPGLLSLSFYEKDGEAILHRMDFAHICVSTGAACNSVDTEISHVLKAIGLDEDYAKGTIRISLGKNNTEEDVKYIASTLAKIVSI